ncbi:MAG: DUF5606 family protein [Chitinophagaceae bacterium]
MEYTRIVAVTGLPGLFELMSSKSDGAIVRSLEDGTTKFVSARVHNLSHLESIEVYTTGENVNLAEVMTAMKSSKSKLPDTKDNKALKSYFEDVYPDIDFERVYASDMKKMVKWYEVLDKNDIEIKLSEEDEEEETEEEAEEPAEEKKVSDAAKKTKTTLEVSGDDTAETAKPKTKLKPKAESKPAAKAESKKETKAPAKKESGATTKTATTKAAAKKSAAKKKESK